MFLHWHVNLVWQSSLGNIHHPLCFRCVPSLMTLPWRAPCQMARGREGSTITARAWTRTLWVPLKVHERERAKICRSCSPPGPEAGVHIISVQGEDTVRLRAKRFLAWNSNPRKILQPLVILFANGIQAWWEFHQFEDKIFPSLFAQIFTKFGGRHQK